MVRHEGSCSSFICRPSLFSHFMISTHLLLSLHTRNTLILMIKPMIGFWMLLERNGRILKQT